MSGSESVKVTQNDLVQIKISGDFHTEKSEPNLVFLHQRQHFICLVQDSHILLYNYILTFCPNL